MDPEGSRNVVSAAFVSIASALVLVSGIFVLRFPPGYETEGQTVSVSGDPAASSTATTASAAVSTTGTSSPSTTGPGSGAVTIVADESEQTLPEPVAEPGAATTYRVESGDTLSLIAERFGVRVTDIVALNGIADPDLIFPGQVFRLDDGSAVVVTVGLDGFDETPFTETAAAVGVERELLMAVAWVASGWDPVAGGGVGIGQLTPESHAFVERELVGGTLDPADVDESIAAMGAYLGWLFEQAGGETSSALAAYSEDLLTARNIGWGPDTLAFVEEVRQARSQFIDRG